MSLADLQGVTYGPLPYRTDPEKVHEYREAVGAAPDEAAAPRSLAGALLFTVAPHLLGDDRAADSVRSVIHGDQSFTWHRPIPMGTELAVTGVVRRVRERSGVHFVGFDLDVTAGGEVLVAGTSTFLMSGAGATPGTGGEERREPEPQAGGRREVTGSLSAGVSVLGRFAASRADLVRYAGASRDWNPIHWDHDAAVAAGLPGVVVHGLLQSAWVIEAAVRLGLERSAAKFRYRRPLGAASVVELTGVRRGDGASFELSDAEGPYLTAVFD